MEAFWSLALGVTAIVLVLPIVNFILALGRRSEIRQLRERIESLEADLIKVTSRLRAGAAPSPAPATAAPHAARTVDAPPSAPPPSLIPAVPAPLPVALANAPRADGAPVGAPPPRPAAGSTPPPLPARPPASPPTVAALSTAAAVSARIASPISAPPREGFEERLGAKLFVILGAIALMLAGGYLVKYSIDRNWINPRIRVAAGFLFGSALVALGLKLREKSNWVAQGAAAAGVFTLYAAGLAGHHLYSLYGRWECGGYLALVTLAAIALAMRIGLLVALLGLIGGYAVPALIGGGELRPVALTLYLLALQGALLVVARRMRWTAVALASLAASGLWVATWLGLKYQAGHVLPLGILIVAGMAMHALAGGGAKAAREPDAAAGGSAALAAIAGLLLGGGLVFVSEFTPTAWLFHGLLAAATLWLGRRERALRPLPWLSLGFTLALLSAWGFRAGPPPEFAAVALALAALFAAGGWLASRGAEREGAWVLLVVLSAAAHLVLAWRVMGPLAGALSWGMLSALLAAGCAALLAPIARAGLPEPRREAAAGWAAGAAGFVAFAIPLELPRTWIAVGWALLLPALAFIHARLPIPALRLAARVIAGLVLLRLSVPLFGMGAAAGDHPLLSWLPYGYGLPILAAWGAGRLFAADDQPRDALAQRLLAFALGFIALPLLVRQYFAPGDWLGPAPILPEWALVAILWLSAGWRIGRPADGEDPPRRRAGLVYATAGLVALALGPCLIANPVLTAQWVGETPVFNALLLYYGAPLGLIALWWRRLDREDAPVPAALAGGAGLLLLFLLLNLEVRQFFHGGDLHAGPASHGEQFAYSACWALFGLSLLLAALPAQRPRLRHASLAVMLLTCAKVFFFDTGHLRGLYRVFACLAAGAALLAFGYVYQRSVFKPGPERG